MSSNELISYQELLDLVSHKNLYLNNIGESLGKEEKSWRCIVDSIELKDTENKHIVDNIGIKEKVIDLLYKLQKILKQLKNDSEFKEYILSEIRKKQYEIIERLCKNNLQKKQSLDNYIRENIGFKRNKYKNLPIKAELEYKNITDENLDEILNIVEIEGNRVIIKDDISFVLIIFSSIPNAINPHHNSTLNNLLLIITQSLPI